MSHVLKEMCAEKVLSPWVGSPGRAEECGGLKVVHTEPRGEANAGFKTLQTPEAPSMGGGTLRLGGSVEQSALNRFRNRGPWQWTPDV